VEGQEVHIAGGMKVHPPSAVCDGGTVEMEVDVHTMLHCMKEDT
jgi:hypothetical protein